MSQFQSTLILAIATFATFAIVATAVPADVSELQTLREGLIVLWKAAVSLSDTVILFLFDKWNEVAIQILSSESWKQTYIIYLCMNSTGHYSNSPNSQQCQCSVWCAEPYTRIPASQCYTCLGRSYISCGWACLDRCLQMGQLTFIIIIMLWFAAVHAFHRIDTNLW